ncbi:thymidylate synthase [Rhodobacter viridis]|uniref:thymidylate synthase n=1 Tax=Rhodobacter viridis TaxID=1054202 RepID=A0A318TW89_9RHOB|nr:thymidylate synthase [Rhodobacter viridis]PYF08663.1 thymidylate synthase [Rhodobacter viridis]
MQSIDVDSYPEFLTTALTLLFKHRDGASPRGRDTLELMDVSFRIRYPSRRHPNSSGRNANVFALVAETLWVLGGRNDLSFIEAYLPRMREFSDDGVTVGGGYGPRIRSWKSVDQLSSILTTLSNDYFSRRAIVSLFDPEVDHDQTRRDIPCNSILQFTVRDNTLNLAVTSRSMDIIWGSAINVFEWTTLQEMVAFWLQLPIGTYVHHVGSLHIYDDFYGRGERIIKSEPPKNKGAIDFDIPFDKFDQSLKVFFDVESRFRSGDLFHKVAISHSLWLYEVVELTRAYWLAKFRRYPEARQVLADMRSTENVAMAFSQVASMEKHYG